ncbi:hypothetical protein EI427_22525 [Flammeovirga pectinis]|uniref:DUF4595 domain-containing protein n=1 Tax=Flammeovirga pectinis TaxID=2494373 RepID=A0A3S9P9X1_9BACT|nr:hypothetical protein [Flammeovirga pectinis]AZQ65000.1 hypothetical protein EI427_22525 [Flammeovirga pectinis]
MIKNLILLFSLLSIISCKNDTTEEIVPELKEETKIETKKAETDAESEKEEKVATPLTSKFNNKEYLISSYSFNKANVKLTFNYDKNNLVIGGEFKDATYTVDYTNGKVSKIDILNGAKIDITYNGNTITQEVTNTNFYNDKIVYTLNTDGKVIKIKNSTGLIDLEFDYDANGNVKKSLEVDTGKEWEHNFSDQIDSPYVPVREVMRYLQLLMGKDLHQSIETESTNRLAKWYGWDYIYTESDLSFTQELKGQTSLTKVAFKKL